MTIVLCSKGYPLNYKKNIKINNIDKFKNTKIIFIPRGYKDRKK